MTDDAESKRYYVDPGNLAAHFPTHKHGAEFWEALGRTIATFSFLEEILGKAIFSFTAMRQIPESESEAAYEKWLPTLEKALSDPLGGLIKRYGKAIRAYDGAIVADLDDLLKLLREASTWRNVLCHGSWRTPDDEGRSIPLFVDRNMQVFQTPIDIACLRQVQQHAAELVCAVMNTVTQMGWQFPGSGGPGDAIPQS
ncbi:MAG: hypothetical protein ACTSX7_13205 [Alphaproteobacteria bacterium]